MRVGAVVVTYNRPALLLECLAALARQTPELHEVLIIDNASAPDTCRALADAGLVPGAAVEHAARGEACEYVSLAPESTLNLRYVRLDANTGGAGGFAEGLRRALELNWEWVWLMDDDAQPRPEALKLLLERERPDAAVLVGRVEEPVRRGASFHRGLVNGRRLFPTLQRPVPDDVYASPETEIDMASFVGFLVRASAVRRAGLPRADFFIQHDDLEYSLRIKEYGKIILLPASVMLHHFAVGRRSRKLFGRVSYRLPRSQIWLSYFGVRNLVYLARAHADGPLHFWAGLAKYCLRQTAAVMLFDDAKPVRLACLARAVRDGLAGDFTNRYPFALRERCRERG